MFRRALELLTGSKSIDRSSCGFGAFGGLIFLFLLLLQTRWTIFTLRAFRVRFRDTKQNEIDQVCTSLNIANKEHKLGLGSFCRAQVMVRTPPDVADTRPCRKWGAINLLMRFKNKIQKKFFWDRILTDPDPPEGSSMHSATDESIISGSHHHHDLQYYFDAMDDSQGFGETLGPCTQLPNGESTSHEQGAFLTLADFDVDDINDQSAAQTLMDQQQIALPNPSAGLHGENGENVDAKMELPDDYSGALEVGHLNRVETAEIVDGGTLNTPALQPAEWQQIMLLRQFLEIDGVVQAGAGWRMVVSVVSAFRRISRLVRIRRLQRSTSGQSAGSSTSRRRGAPTRYKGIRARNDKWVSEIRIAGTLEKVWLGSYNTEKEAALAFDAGKHHCSGVRRARNFNFSESPRLLGPPQSLLHLSSVDRRTKIQRLAEDHARAFGSADIQ